MAGQWVGPTPPSIRIGEALVWALSLALFGGGAAVGQWLLLRPHMSRPTLWIAANAAAWPVGWVVGYMLSKLTGPRIGLRLTGIVPYPTY